MKNSLSIRSYSTKPTRHAHNFHQLVLPLRGVINIKVGAFNGKVAPSECVVVKAKESHLFTANSEARFVVADLAQLPDNLLNAERIVFAINTALISYLAFVENQLEQQLNRELEDAMLHTFYLLLKEQTLMPKVDDRIAASLSFIEHNTHAKLRIKDLANIAFLSETQFKKLFKQQTGLTVNQHVTKVRMTKAKALLTHTDYTLPIIGEKVGYPELSAFSRKFSHYFGLPPTRFKR